VLWLVVGVLALVPVTASLLALAYPSGLTLWIGAIVAFVFAVAPIQFFLGQFSSPVEGVVGGALLLAAALLLYAAVADHRSHAASGRPRG
jgi:hypothetical protein